MVTMLVALLCVWGALLLCDVQQFTSCEDSRQLPQQSVKSASDPTVTLEYLFPKVHTFSYRLFFYVFVVSFCLIFPHFFP